MTAIIVDADGRAFSRWAAKLAPRYDGDDDSFVRCVSFLDPEWAHVYSSRRAAERALEKIKLYHFRPMAVVS